MNECHPAKGPGALPVGTACLQTLSRWADPETTFATSCLAAGVAGPAVVAAEVQQQVQWLPGLAAGLGWHKSIRSWMTAVCCIFYDFVLEVWNNMKAFGGHQHGGAVSVVPTWRRRSAEEMLPY